jgi:hypothetical protein
MPTLAVRPWPDPVIDTLGHDPRSVYVERFWLPTLGPTSLLLLRRIAAELDERPEGIDLDLADTSQALGLGYRIGTSSPLARSFERLAQFDLACTTGEAAFAVRRNVPPVNRRHVKRLPEPLQDEHRAWAEAQLQEPPLATARRRARRIAFTLLEQGDDLDHAERTLHGIGFHPSICRESAQWAHDRHRAALEAALDAAGSEAPLASPAASLAAGSDPAA